MNEIKGYFIEKEIFYKGIKQKDRKTFINSIDCGNLKFESLPNNAKIKVLSFDENWYTILKSEFKSIKNLKKDYEGML